MALQLSRPLSPGWVRRDAHSRYRENKSWERAVSSPAPLKTRMQESRQRINVVWFKSTDLRTHDHAALQAARAQQIPCLNLYIFDPFWFGKTRDFGFPKTGSVRARFLLESVTDLSQRLRDSGSDLCVRHGSSAGIFRELTRDFEVVSVFAFHEVCAEELRIQAEVKQVLAGRLPGATLKLFWGFELYHYDDMQFLKRRTFPKTYSAFRRSAEECSVRPCVMDVARQGRSNSVSWTLGEAVPTYEELGLQDPGPPDPRAEKGLWTGGETAALARVDEYIWLTDQLANHYVGATMTTDPAKSCMRDKAFFKISPWLAHGCISPRYIYEEVTKYENERRKTKSTGWIVHELIWRDFVRFGARHYGTKIFKIGGMNDVYPSWEWSRDADRFQKWKMGLTGVPFIDVFMRELSTTGYCNHMGRETAGWFLIADLGLDWRMGAEWFESMLIDFEPAANWFNWAYRCLPACVAKSLPPMSRLQTVEALKWCAQHDPDATYIKRWLPELAGLPASIAREPWRLELSGTGAEEARGRSGGVLDGRLGEIATAVPNAPAPEKDQQPGKDGIPRKKQFTISKRDLQEVMALGFHELDAAMALKDRSVAEAVAHLMDENPQLCAGCGFLRDEGAADPSAWHNWYCYKCWQGWGGMPDDVTGNTEDADMQAALQMSMGHGEGNSAISATEDVTSNTEEANMQTALQMSGGHEGGNSASSDHEDVEAAMLAEAIRLSLQESAVDKCSQNNNTITPIPKADSIHSYGNFVLGRDYPYPMLEPVSLRGTDTVADEARTAQQQRDAQILKAELRRSSAGYQRSKPSQSEMSARSSAGERQQEVVINSASAVHPASAGGGRRTRWGKTANGAKSELQLPPTSIGA